MAVLRGRDSVRIDNELEQLEAKVKEARERKEQLAVKQSEVVGRIMLGLVSSGKWSEAQLHDLLRPHMKRSKDFALLGMSKEQGSMDDSSGVDDISLGSGTDDELLVDDIALGRADVT